MNLMTLLLVCAKMYKKRLAIQDEKGCISYADLAEKVRHFSQVLYQTHKIRPNTQVAIMGRNEIDFVVALFACSRIGADIYLLNVEMTATQIDLIHHQYPFDCIIYDRCAEKNIDSSHYQGNKIDFSVIALHSSSTQVLFSPIPRSYHGKIIVHSGGTTGNVKISERKPNMFEYLSPFFALVEKLHIQKAARVYNASPIYHGYGLASLFFCFTIGASQYFMPKFEAEKATKWIDEEKIDTIILVPVMLQRLLNFQPARLHTLQNIVSGAAALNPTVIERCFQLLGKKLYNLYGTSEGGFSLIATPEDLSQHPHTIGKPLMGVEANILNPNNQILNTGETGKLFLKSKWAIPSGNQFGVETGDLAYKDAQGYFYLCGRIDDMIVSGGENVYPIELENIIIQHPEIHSVAVIGIEDIEFGQRLKAFVVKEEQSDLDAQKLLDWLIPRTPRFQIPKQIVFQAQLPYTTLGKPDKKKLH